MATSKISIFAKGPITAIGTLRKVIIDMLIFLDIATVRMNRYVY